MEVILCLDDNKGMLFNKRRQSRDSEVIKDIINNLQNKTLNISPFSEKLFSEFTKNVEVKENPLTEGNVAFVENLSLEGMEEKIKKLVTYNWNRNYPSDLKCRIDFSKYKLIEEKEFKGTSHEKITKRIFERR